MCSRLIAFSRLRPTNPCESSKIPLKIPNSASPIWWPVLVRGQVYVNEHGYALGTNTPLFAAFSIL